MKNTTQIIAIALLIAGLGSCKKGGGADEEVLPVLKTFTISGTASSSLNSQAENTGVKSMVNLTEGKSYTYDEALANQSKTDLVLRTSYYAGGVPTSSRDLFVSSVKSGSAWSGNENLANFGIRLNCKLAVADGIKFDDIKTKKQLEEAYAKILPEYFYENSNFMNNENLTLVFSTQAGKLGLMKLTNYTANKPFSYVIDIKIEE